MTERAKRASSGDVARLAGVSRTTVSYVLCGRTDQTIPEATRRRVLDAAQALGYRSNRLANGLLRGRSQCLGMIVAHFGTRFIGRIIEGVQNEGARRGYHVLLANTQSDPAQEARQVDLMLQHRVEGLLVIGHEWTLAQMPDWLPLVEAAGVPCVMIDDRTYADRLPCVVNDDVVGACRVTAHLIAQGHRRIGHLSGGAGISTARDRRRGFEDALREAGLPIRAEHIQGSEFSSPEVAERAMDALLSLAPRPTAVFVAADHLLPAALRAVRARGLRIPEDLALAGYGNLDMTEPLEITTVDQDYAAMGHQAAARLFACLDAPEDAALRAGEIVIPTRLIVRRSTDLRLKPEGAS